METDPDIPLRQAYRLHGRHWRDNAYCYPVVSRRSGGLSIGINLNPDTACNFDCIYCQVDRTTPPAVRKVDLGRLRSELDHLLDIACDGSLFSTSPFDAVAPDRRRVCDIAFSGDGEPTSYLRFDEAVRIAAEAKAARGLDRTKLILITDACYLTKPKVVAGLRRREKAQSPARERPKGGVELAAGFGELVDLRGGRGGQWPAAHQAALFESGQAAGENARTHTMQAA